MKSSDNSHDAVFAARARLREFGVARFGSLKNFAAELGITPQNLNGYLSGDRNPGRVFLSRLSELGFDVSVFFDTHQRVSPANPPFAPSGEVLDFVGIEEVIGRTLEEAAPSLGVTTSQVAGWRQGDAIPAVQMVRLLNSVVSISLGRIRQQASRPASSPDTLIQASA